MTAIALALVHPAELCHSLGMKRPVVILMLCLLAGFLAWSELRQAGEGGTESGPVEASGVVPVPIKPETSEPVPVKNLPMESVKTNPALPLSAQPPGVPPGPEVAAGDGKTGPRFKRAYMLSLDKGAVTFLEAQDIEGDFATERQKLEEWSGMLRCRLLSETDVVLAEEVLPAPDYVCTVLDPTSQPPRPVTLNPQRPVVFQVRLPRVKGASRLNIYRIVQPGAQPLEGLLASIPLPPS